MAEGLELNVRLAMESQSFQQQVTAINRQMTLVQSSFNSASTALEGFGSEQDRLRAQSASLSDQIDLGRQRVTLLTEAQNRARTTLETNANANEQLRQRVQEVNTAYQASVTATGATSAESQRLEAELRQLNSEYVSSNNTLANNARSLDNLSIRTNNAQRSLNELETQLQSTDRELAIQNAGWRDLSERMTTASETLKSAGKKITEVGKTLTMGITLPLVGVGTAAIKVGMDFESAMSRVKAISGATGEEFTKLNELALKLGADTAFSAKEAAQGMENLASAGFSVSEIMDAMPGMLDLAASGGLDVATASDIAGSALRGFGIDANQAGHVADVLAKAAADTNADVQGMGEALKYAAPPAHALGMTLEEVSAAVGTMSNAGIKGEQAGTILRGSLISLSSPSKEAADSMKTLGFNAFDSQGKMLPFKDVIDRLKESTKNLSDEKKADALATIFGKESLSGMMVLMDAGPAKIDELTKSFQGSDGVAKAMALTMQDNAKASIDAMMGSLETAAIKIETAVAPTIKKFADTIQELANKFSALSPEQQEFLLKMAVAVAAIGPVVVIVGTLASAIGSILGIIGTVSGAIAVVSTGAAAATPAIGALAGAFTLLTGPVGIAVAIIAGAALGIGLLVNHLRQDAIPATDLFGTTTSDATKKAVQGYLDLDEKATKSLMSLNFSGQSVSKETATVLVKNFDDMGTQIKAGMDKHYNESFTTMQDFFNKSSTLTTTEEATALAAMTKNNEDRKKSIDDGEKQISDILTAASNAKRSLTSDEQVKINEIQDTMKTNAIKSLSDTELESASILERMKAQAGEITAKQAAEVVKNSLEQKEKAVKNAEDQYDKTVKAIIKQRDETGSITKDQADALIKEAGRQKDEAVTKATEMNNKVVDQAKLQAKDHVNQVDWTTGEVKSKWQVMKDDTSAKMNDIGKAISDKWAEIKKDVPEKVEQMKTDISNKWNEIKTTADTAWESIKKAVTDPIEEAKKSINMTLADIKGYFDKFEIPTITVKIKWGGPDDAIPYPSFSVKWERLINWNAEGGIFTRPTLLGGNQGVGEAGAEAVLPISKLDGIVASALVKANKEMGMSNGVTQNLTINSPTPLTPSEIARQSRNSLRELALNF